MTGADLEKLLADATPGEWWVGEEDHFDGIAVMYRDGYVSVANVPTWHTDRSGEANARLIALTPTLASRVIAAKQLAEALARIMDYEGDQWSDDLDAKLSMQDIAKRALTAWDAAQ